MQDEKYILEIDNEIETKVQQIYDINSQFLKIRSTLALCVT